MHPDVQENLRRGLAAIDHYLSAQIARTRERRFDRKCLRNRPAIALKLKEHESLGLEHGHLRDGCAVTLNESQIQNPFRLRPDQFLLQCELRLSRSGALAGDAWSHGKDDMSRIATMNLGDPEIRERVLGQCDVRLGIGWERSNWFGAGLAQIREKRLSRADERRGTERRQIFHLQH